MVISVISGVISGVPKYRKDPERRKKTRKEAKRRKKTRKGAKRRGKSQKDGKKTQKIGKRPPKRYYIMVSLSRNSLQMHSWIIIEKRRI